MARTFYDVLGVAQSASPDEMRRAYRRAARRLHPDASDRAGSTAEMAALNEAWRVLSDPARRAAYDLALDPPSAPSPSAPWADGGPPPSAWEPDGPEDEDDTPLPESGALRRLRYVMAFWALVTSLAAVAFVAIALFG